MERRTVLRLLSSAFPSGVLGRPAAAAAQAPRTPSPRGLPAAGAPAIVPAPTASAPGVTPREIRIGMSAAFKGTAAGLGTEFYRGAQAYYDEVNGRGGVHGRVLVVVGLDDRYEPVLCVKNTIQFIEK